MRKEVKAARECVVETREVVRERRRTLAVGFVLSAIFRV